MTTIVLALTALMLVPAPQKMSVTDGAFAANLIVTYSRDMQIPAEGYRLDVPTGGVGARSSGETAMGSLTENC